MKVTMEVECTPIEARQFFGLPDVQPMQASVMKKLEEKALIEIERYSPEQMLKSWFSGLAKVRSNYTVYSRKCSRGARKIARHALK